LAPIDFDFSESGGGFDRRVTGGGDEGADADHEIVHAVAPVIGGGGHVANDAIEKVRGGVEGSFIIKVDADDCAKNRRVGADDGFPGRVDPFQREGERGFVFRGDSRDGVAADQSAGRGFGPTVELGLGHGDPIGDHAGKVWGVTVARFGGVEGRIPAPFEFPGDGFEVTDFNAEEGIDGAVEAEIFLSLLRAEGFELRHDIGEFHGR